MKTINIKVVPEDLHRECKAQAAKEGKHLQEWIIEAMREKLERSQGTK